MNADSSVVVDLLTLKRSDYLEELRNAVPAPRTTSPPDIGLPRWRRTPLDTRIPAAPSPQEVVLARRKLGEPLRLELANGSIETSPAAVKRFDMSDPYNRETPLPYEGLHDPHLARFFLGSAAIQETMVKAGLLTDELDVKCSLKEYNDYRNYLRMMHGKAMRRELERRDELHREKLLLDVARKQTMAECERLKKEENTAKLLNEIRMKKEQKLQDLLDKWKRCNQRIRSMNQTQRQMLHEKIAEARLQRSLFEKKRAAMAKKEQQHLLNALKNLHERDVRLAKTLEQNEAKRRDARIEEVVDRFEKKKKEQEEMVEREKLLKEYLEKEKKNFLKEYEEKLTRSRKKLQDLFIEKRKALEKSRNVRKKKLKKRIDTCCCKAN